MPETKTVTIEVSEEHAKKIRVMIKKGAFDITNGSAVLHYNDRGILMDIDFHIKGYNYKKEPYDCEPMGKKGFERSR